MKRKRFTVIAGAILYALFAAVGYEVERGQVMRWDRVLLRFAALLIPAGAILFALLCISAHFALPQRKAKSFRPARAFFLIFLCYVPFFVIAFPGSFCYDVPFQLKQVFTGNFSDHHPLLHTLWLGACVRLGVNVGHTNLGAALYSLTQMALLALCFARTCASVSRWSGDGAARRCAVVFALYPLHMAMACNATKDVLFSGLFALTLALAVELSRGGASARRCASFVLCGAGMMLLRNNAVYAAAVWLALLPLLLGKRGTRLMLCAAAAIALCVSGSHALKRAVNASSGDPSEMLSLPIQQLARARLVASDRLNSQERAAIDRLMPNQAWRLYDETISDPVKFEFDTAELMRDFKGYAKLTLQIAAKCPDVFAEALARQIHAFIYPYSRYRVSGYYLQLGVSDAYYDGWRSFAPIREQSPLPDVLSALKWRFGAQGAMQFPAVGWLFNMGLILWAMLYFQLRALYLGQTRRFAAQLLTVLLWGTFLLGPVMAGRYVYPFVCALPVMASRSRKGEGD